MIQEAVAGPTRRNVVILDYGSGNLRSAERALERAGANVTVTPDLSAAAAADGLVVPGVGAYAACMAGVEKLGAAPVIAERVAAGRPVLGICVGMQIMFEYGEEHGVVTQGLGLLPGGVTRLPADRVPHMGWNAVDVSPGSALFAGLADGTRFYFVHSYAVLSRASLDEAGALVTTCTHELPFVAAVEHGPVAAAQFHPEKSADAGAVLLRNWVAGLTSRPVGAADTGDRGNAQRACEADLGDSCGLGNPGDAEQRAAGATRG